jgi:polyphosphate kinase
MEGREGREEKERRGEERERRAVRGRSEVGGEALWQAAVCQPSGPLQHVQHPIYFSNIQMKHLQHTYKDNKTLEIYVYSHLQHMQHQDLLLKHPYETFATHV